MKYKGYSEKHFYSRDDNLWVGELVGIKDLITFDSSDINTLESEFHNAVDDYLSFCKEINKDPETPLGV